MGRAFGVDLAVGFGFPGLGPVPATGVERPAHLTLGTRRAVAAEWPGAATVLVDHRRHGRSLYRLEAHPEGGYLVAAPGWGRYVIGADGTAVRCAPVQDAAWRWQRFLVGHVLPLLALVRGHEVFHASAVAYGGRAVAFTGPSGAGKSSLAFALLRAGWDFVADDVAAVDAASTGEVMVHPGTGLIGLRPGPGGADPRATVGRLGRILGHDGQAARVAVPVDTAPRPLRALVVLDRRVSANRLRIQPMRPVDPRVLLGAAFELAVQTPQRLVRQLELCARMATELEVYRLSTPPQTTPDEAAGFVARELVAP